MQKVEIPISEYDLEALKEVVYGNGTILWVFKDQNGTDIEIEFITGALIVDPAFQIQFCL